jgi:hypothetical protein
MTWRLLALLTRLGLGLLLFSATLSLSVALIETHVFHRVLVYVGIVLGGLWWLYSRLPDWMKEALRFLWKQKTHDDD